jgi:arylsulfatase A-like enzyme
VHDRVRLDRRRPRKVLGQWNFRQTIQFRLEAAGVRTTGVNLLPYLEGQTIGAPHESLYWRFGPQKAVRKGRWKLVDWRDFGAKRNSGWQLYDLEKDVGERVDLASSQPAVVAELSAGWSAWNRRNVPPSWRGGATEDPTAPAAR